MICKLIVTKLSNFAFTTPFVLLYIYCTLSNLPLIAITNTTDLEQSLEPVPPISESPHGVYVERVLSLADSSGLLLLPCHTNALVRLTTVL